MTTIEDIRNIKWNGSHAADFANFKIVEQFVIAMYDAKKFDEAYEALCIQGKEGMGIDPTEESDASAEEYVEMYIQCVVYDKC